MTKQEVVALTCKLLGIYMFLYGLVSLSSMFTPFWELLASRPHTGMISPLPVTHLGAGLLTVYLLTTIFLWKGANWLSHHMVNDAETSIAPIIVDQSIQRVAFSFLGLFTIVESIPRICNLLVRSYILSHWATLAQPSRYVATAPEAAALVIQFILGLWLLFRAPELVEWLHSLRAARAAKPPQSLD